MHEFILGFVLFGSTGDRIWNLRGMGDLRQGLYHSAVSPALRILTVGVGEMTQELEHILFKRIIV